MNIHCTIILNVNPKTKAPKIKVLKGVKEFKIDAIELSIPLTANANKNTGIKVPKIAVETMCFQCFL